METRHNAVGDLLRTWRGRRRLSQLELASEAEISTRHLSFVESGRSTPSREMLLRLAEPLGLPMRERDLLLLAGGYAPVHGERRLDQPEMAAAKAAVETVLEGHAPYPALAVDRHRNLIVANAAVTSLLEGCDPVLLQPPVNVLRLSLAPTGLAARIVNLAEWRQHLLVRLQHEVNQSGDPVLAAMHEELSAFPFASSEMPPSPANAVAVPLVLRSLTGGANLSFLSTTTVFGTATDITLSELTLECFYPADAQTRTAMFAQSPGSSVSTS